MPSVQITAQTTGGRGHRGPRVASALSEINVVPLVDVMLVLLVIFMVTAPMMQRGLDVNLPVSRRARALSDERIFITVPLAYRTDRTVQIGDEVVSVDVLQERVRQVLLSQTDKEVYLRGDGGILLQELMDVMDELKEAGVQRVGIVTDIPRDR
jgi:biopolymer transport protein ExbD